MGKTIDSVEHLKNRVLLITYIFRSLPMEYLQKTVEEGKPRQQIRNTIVFLKRDQFVVQKKAMHGAYFLYLTKHGYDFVNKKILKVQEEQPLYVHKRYRVLRKSISEHSFMNFMFIWHYLTMFPEDITPHTKIYEDSNMNQCKLPTYYGERNIVVSPDIMILLPDTKSTIFQKALFIENDTGRETYREIYQKLVEYAVLTETGMGKNKLSEFALYFIVPTKKRLHQLFYNPTGILSFFSSYNNTKQIKDVRIRTIMKSFSNPKVKVYVSSFDDENLSEPYKFQEYLLVDLLLMLKPEWRIFVNA